jgi:hypothetical protein
VIEPDLDFGIDAEKLAIVIDRAIRSDQHGFRREKPAPVGVRDLRLVPRRRFAAESRSSLSFLLRVPASPVCSLLRAKGLSMPVRFRAPAALVLSVVSCLALLSGCSTSSSSNTARTAKEQLLISNAVDQALETVDFSSFYGQKVFFDEKYLDGVDKTYVIGSVRHRLLLNGATLASKTDDADVVLEARSGGIGTDSTETFYGIPEVVLPGMLTLPELKAATRNSQRGTAKLAFVAYDAKTNSVLGSGGTSLAVSDYNDWNVLGVGPFKTGTVKQEISSSTAGHRYQPKNPNGQIVSFEPPSQSSEVRTVGHQK